MIPKIGGPHTTGFSFTNPVGLGTIKGSRGRKAPGCEDRERAGFFKSRFFGIIKKKRNTE